MLLRSQNKSVTHIENFLEALEGEFLNIRVKNAKIYHFESQKNFKKNFILSLTSRFVSDTYDDTLLFYPHKKSFGE